MRVPGSLAAIVAAALLLIGCGASGSGKGGDAGPSRMTLAQLLRMVPVASGSTALTKIVDALTAHRWQAEKQGAWTALTRTQPITDTGWDWAFRQDFLVDRSRGLLLSHVHGTTVGVAAAHTETIADVIAPEVVADAATMVTGELRVGAAACPVYGLADRNPAPPRAFVELFAAAIGGLGPVDAVAVGETSPDGGQAEAAVELPSTEQAVAELARRAGARARWDAAFHQDYGVAVTASRQAGKVDVFALHDRAAADLPAAVGDQAVGVDSCGVN